MKRKGRRIYSLGLGAAVPVWVALAGMGEVAFNPLHAMAGRWEARDPAGHASGDCSANWWEYRISADRSEVELILHRDGTTERERYRVLHVAADRVLLLIEGERRRNEFGGPVTWWAVFDSRNRFRWRRDDWPDNAVTALEWQRCW